jgi:putative ABC transport system permease protein
VYQFCESYYCTFVRRAKEVGIRKVLAAKESNSSCSFSANHFSYALLLCIAMYWSTVVALFNDLANKALSLSYLLDAKLIAGYICLYIITGIACGFYPALVLSGLILYKLYTVVFK